ncbi:HAUS augmin-like complex subunit 6 N-terminus [Carex littledalei]|uniref:HAUS augmin-like complex subunit 6 N-terminus n=1 Tax=Carex littledalei TaxID=544730 RepID=A0A833RDT0_9POAL|nr:HAUS augmin-like complex subunit 6 N-terminus [Carex littledalei]
MATEREKEREAELESAMYTNCLLLGLDPTVLETASNGGGVRGGASPRVGFFKHSNPKLGEQLLYFLLSALRGPIQSAKDFDKAWPIYDSAQSREFRKIVQGIISELEMQGALPRSSSRVSSLATCCGPRFVELLWQLSVHTLREVYKRMFASDATSDPLPSALTDYSYLNAAALLPISKARIALERRKFLENASIAVHRQNTWSNLANEMTAEFRSLCAEEAYLQQELEKLQELRNKAKAEGESWDDRASSSSGQTSHLVSKATRLWESLLARRSQHEVLASGPIEDAIAHREHRYRISGTSLLAAMQRGSQDALSAPVGELSPQAASPQINGINDDASSSTSDDRTGLVHPTVDVTEILRRWTHALQRIHKQSLYLAKANGGEGPDLLRDASDGDSSGHAESLASTLAEHRQHLVSIQGLINQLKEAIPTLQKSITDLTGEVNAITGSTTDELNSSGSRFSVQTQNTENGADELADVASKLSTLQIEKAPSPAPKLPYLFSLTPNPPGKNTQTPKRNAMTSQMVTQTVSNESVSKREAALTTQASLTQDNDGYNAYDIRRSVREAALSKPITNSEPHKSISNDASDFFMPLTSRSTKERSVDSTTPPNLRKHRLVYPSPKGHTQKASVPDRTRGFAAHDHQRSSFLSLDDSLDQVFSPPLLMESNLFPDTYEDLLAPLSETDAALMEH